MPPSPLKVSSIRVVLQLSNAEPCARLMLTLIRHVRRHHSRFVSGWGNKVRDGLEVHLSGSRWALLGFRVLFLLLPTSSFLMHYFSTPLNISRFESWDVFLPQPPVYPKNRAVVLLPSTAAPLACVFLLNYVLWYQTVFYVHPRLKYCI